MSRYYKDGGVYVPRTYTDVANPLSTKIANVGDLTLNTATGEFFACTAVAPTTAATTWIGTSNLFNATANSSFQVAPEGKGIIGSIVSHDAMTNNVYNDTNGNISSTGGPWTTYYNYQPHTDNSAIQFINMALGDGMGDSGSSQFMYGNEGYSGTGRELQFANGNRLGHSRSLQYQKNNQGTAGYGFRMMPIRNTSNAAVTISLYSYSSNYWNNGYEGRAMFVLAPATSTGPKYSQVTSIGSTLISNTGYSSNGAQYSQTGTYTIPANTTVIICQSSTDWYYTTYQFIDTNYFYNLNTTFSNPAIICDMRMLSALNKSHFNMAYSGSFVTTGAKLWTVTGSDFGDR